MSRQLATQPLAAEKFAGFGEVLQAKGTPDKLINQGLCGRYHDRATLEFLDGRAGISIFHAQARTFPFTLDMMERHPAGSQAFIPMHQNTYLVVAAADEDGAPGTPQAFIANAGQGINLHRNVWHGVLCPLHEPGLFAVIDRIGDGSNLEEHWFKQPWIITHHE